MPDYLERLDPRWHEQQDALDRAEEEAEKVPAALDRIMEANGFQRVGSRGMEDIYAAMLAALRALPPMGPDQRLADDAAFLVEHLRSLGFVLVDRSRMESTLRGLWVDPNPPTSPMEISEAMFRAWGIDR